MDIQLECRQLISEITLRKKSNSATNQNDSSKYEINDSGWLLRLKKKQPITPHFIEYTCFFESFCFVEILKHNLY